MYFQLFPHRWFTLSNGETILYNNFTRAVGVTNSIVEDETNLINYIIADGERAEQISQRVYGSTEYWWIIYHVNRIENPVVDWPYPNSILDDIRLEEFPNSSPVDVHHYEDKYDNIVDINHFRALYPNYDDARIVAENELTIVTLDEFYTGENEEKRNIRLVDPLYIDVIAGQLEALFYSAINRN